MQQGEASAGREQPHSARGSTPREMWFYREMASRPWDPRLVKAGDIEYIMQVSQQLLNKSLCPSFVFCHSSVSYTCVLYLQLSTRQGSQTLSITDKRLTFGHVCTRVQFFASSNR